MKMVYPYDPDASLVSNYVTETCNTLKYPNKYNVVVPLAAPFYRVGLEVRDTNDRLLIEGIDYYLGYYYKSLADGTGKAIYGGIMLPDHTTVKVKLRTVGGSHPIADSEIGRYLVKEDLPDPRNVDWADLQRYPTPIEPVSPPSNIDEAIRDDKIVGALDDLRETLLAKYGELDTKYLDLTNALAAVAKKIHDHKILSHHKEQNQHKYTAAGINALEESADAIDAIKAYGLTLAELVDVMITFGINQDRVDELINDTMGLVHGRMVAGAGQTLTYEHEDGRARVHLNGNRMYLDTAGDEIVFEADSDKNEAGVGVELGAGMNMMLIPSAGSVVGGRPSINGTYIITEDLVDKYLFPPLSDVPAGVATSDTPTLEFSGRGVKNNPLSAKAIPPAATVNSSGLWRITDSVTETGSSYAISQWAVTEVRGLLNNMVNKNLRVNGIEFGSNQAITLTKDRLGLSRVNNTAPTDKPVTTALTNALSNKSKKTHTHAASDLQHVPHGSANGAGIVMLHDQVDATTAKAAVPAMGEEIKELIDGVEDDVATRVEAGAASATHYGGSGYLPVPVLGNYGHANYKYPDIAGEEEGDKFVFLTAGASSFGSGVYYNELQLTPSGDFMYLNKTSVEYQPQFLTDAGVKAEIVLWGSPGVFRLIDNNNDYWVVLTRGTMDMTKHVGVKTTPVLARDYKAVIFGDYVYLAHYRGHSDTYFNLRRCRIADIENGVDVEWELVTLSGKDVYGNDINAETVRFTPLGLVDEPRSAGSQAFVFREDDGMWTHIGTRHATQNWDVGVTGNIMRIFGYHRPYLANSYRSSWGSQAWTTSIDIDLDTLEFTIEDPDMMHMTVIESGLPGIPESTNSWNGIQPNNASTRITGKKRFYTPYWYGTLRPPTMGVYNRPSGKDDIDFMKRRLEPGLEYKGAYNIAGEQPTEISSPRNNVAWINDNTLVYQDVSTGYNLVEIDPDNPYEGDEGLGPTTNRKNSPLGVNDATRVPRVCVRGYGNSYNEGFAGIPGDRWHTRLDEFTKSKYYTYDKTGGDAIAEACKATCIAEGTLIESRFISQTSMLYVFGDLTNPIRAFIQHAFMQYRDDEMLSKQIYVSVFEVSYTLSGDVIIPDVASLRHIHSQIANNNSTALKAGSSHSHNHNLVCQGDDGRYFFALQGGFNASWVGNSGRHDCYVAEDGTEDAEGKLNYKAYVHTHYSYRVTGELTYHPKLGVVELSHSTPYDAFYGKPLGWDVDQMYDRTRDPAYTKDVIILSARAAEGWQIYVTQPLQFYANQQAYTAASTEFDLRNLFPGNYKNRTFQIHIELINDVPTYSIDEIRKEDTATRLYIGYVTTDDERIIDLNVERAKRLGNVAPIIQHSANKYAHGYESLDTLSSSKYSLLENKGMVHDFEVVTFKDIFDSWHRFSHTFDNNAQPAAPNELEAWIYREEFDAVECTLNSASYIGFMSNDLVGDYTFNTLMTSHDGDNDAAAVVLAGFKKGDIDDKEHTLTLAVCNSIEGHLRVTTRIQVWDNYDQPDRTLVASLTPETAALGSWVPWYAHVIATRKGNTITVSVKQASDSRLSDLANRDENILKIVNGDGTIVETQTQAINHPAYVTAVLDLNEVAPKFAKPTRFGYGALSQAAVRYWNIERPLDDLSGFYSSEQMLHEALKLNEGDMVKFKGVNTPMNLFPSAQDHQWRWWEKAIEYGDGTFQGSGAYYLPADATAKYITCQPTFELTAGQSFYLCKEIELTSTQLIIKASVDDSASVFIDGVQQSGTFSSALSTRTFTVTPGKHVVAFEIIENPGNSPCHINFAIWDNTTLIEVSDLTWPCAKKTDVIVDERATKVSYPVPAGYETSITAQNYTLNNDNAIPYIQIREPNPDGSYVVHHFLKNGNDVIEWDGMMFKNKLVK